MKQELSEAERRDIIFTVEEEKKGKYWRYIKNHLNETLEREIRNKDEYTIGEMTDKDLKEINRIVIKIECIRFMMNINEDIILKHTRWLDQMKSQITTMFQKAGSFIGVKVTRKE